MTLTATVKVRPATFTTTAVEPSATARTTPAAVNGALLRARASLRTGRDAGDVPLPRSADEAAVVSRFVDALERFDVGALVDVLTSDARLTMPPEQLAVHGPRPIAGFLSGLARGADDRTCGRLGALAAAEVIGHLGARPEASLRDLARENGLLD